MTLDPLWLREAITLTLGRAPDQAQAIDIARVLEAREEVLPWLVLHHGAFSGDESIMKQLRSVAQTGNRASRRRPQGQTIAPAGQQLERDAETALARLIAANLVGSDPADTSDATLCTGYDHPPIRFRAS